MTWFPDCAASDINSNETVERYEWPHFVWSMAAADLSPDNLDLTLPVSLFSLPIGARTSLVYNALHPCRTVHEKGQARVLDGSLSMQFKGLPLYA